MQFLTNIWLFIEAHWAALLVGGVLTGLGSKLLSWADEKGVAYLVAEFEHLRAYTNSTAVGSQIQCDDAIISIIEAVIPEAAHELDDAAQKALAAGDIHAVNWTALGKDIWAKAKSQVESGYHDYLEKSSFSDGEALSAMISKRFFVTQKMAAKGVIVDAPRATVTDIQTTTTQTVEATRSAPAGVVVSEAVHTEVKG